MNRVKPNSIEILADVAAEVARVGRRNTFDGFSEVCECFLKSLDANCLGIRHGLPTMVPLQPYNLNFHILQAPGVVAMSHEMYIQMRNDGMTPSTP